MGFKPDLVVRFERRTLDGTDENVAIALDTANWDFPSCGADHESAHPRVDTGVVRAPV